MLLISVFFKYLKIIFISNIDKNYANARFFIHGCKHYLNYGFEWSKNKIYNYIVIHFIFRPRLITLYLMNALQFRKIVRSHTIIP